MNKRIKKKRLKNDEVRLLNTIGINYEAFNIMVFSCPVEKGFKYPVRLIRYRTYLKKRNLNKRHTLLGSRVNKFF